MTIAFKQPIKATDALRTGDVQQDAHVHALHHHAVRGNNHGHRRRCRPASPSRRSEAPSSARAADPPTYTIDANDQRSGDRRPARGENLVWLAPADNRVGKLLVFLPFGGAANLPTNFEFGSEAGRLGYHTIVLAYKNEVPIANAAACGNEDGAAAHLAAELRDQRAHGDPRTARTLDGHHVNRANSIENRLNKVLAHLATARATPPTAGRSSSTPTAQPNWSDTVIAGASLGAGLAALIGVAALGAPRGVVRRLDRRQARLGEDRSDAPSRYFSLIHAHESSMRAPAPPTPSSAWRRPAR